MLTFGFLHTKVRKNMMYFKDDLPTFTIFQLCLTIGNSQSLMIVSIALPFTHLLLDWRKRVCA